MGPPRRHLPRRLPPPRRLPQLRRALPRRLPPRRALPRRPLPRRALPRRPPQPRRLLLLRRLLPRRALPRRPPRRALPRNRFVSYGSSVCGDVNDLNVERPVSISSCKRASPFFFQFVTCLVVESFRYSCLI